jgi:hypothetical protein
MFQNQDSSNMSQQERIAAWFIYFSREERDYRWQANREKGEI